MAPKLYSRYTYCAGRLDAEDRLFLSEREPFRYVSLPDNLTHQCATGDTLWSLADKYFPTIDRSAGLWWVIADFQPEPIFDPTIALQPGQLLVIPSLQTVLTRVFSEDRRIEETV